MWVVQKFTEKRWSYSQTEHPFFQILKWHKYDIYLDKSKAWKNGDLRPILNLNAASSDMDTEQRTCQMWLYSGSKYFWIPSYFLFKIYFWNVIYIHDIFIMVDIRIGDYHPTT